MKKRIEVSKARPIPGKAQGDPGSSVNKLDQPARLADFFATAKSLSTADRLHIVDQAILLLENFYAHLPLKKAMYGIDPVKQLRLLKYRLPQIAADSNFHAEMLSIFASLRDLHTGYVLPTPYRDFVALLPFRIEKCYENGQVRYIVAGLQEGFSHPSFKPGVEVLYWSGIPIDRAVRIKAGETGGGNRDARLARALAALTTRPLAIMQPPAEDWVTLTYETLEGTKDELRCEWRVTKLPIEPSIDPQSKSPKATFIGLDLETDLVRQTYKLMFASNVIAERDQLTTARDKLTKAAPVEDKLASLLPEFLKAKAVNTSNGAYGYIRIYSFNVEDADVFADEFIRLLGHLPHRGLIIDVRDNGGGLLQAGERLLQVLTPKTIEPERFQFLNTALTLRLCKHSADAYALKDWVPSIERSLETGATYSAGFPLTSPEQCNNIGQRYYGPVVVITSARCYSTTDLFVAGFQDHQIGTVLGVDGSTGAGGATVWTHDVLLQLLASKGNSPPTFTGLRKLPKNSGMRVAIRRATRVGPQAGVELEDFGVKPDHRYYMSRRDVLNDNIDLLEHAGKLLASMPTCELEATASVRNRKCNLTVACEGITKIIISSDDGQLGSRSVSRRVMRFKFPASAAGERIVVSGFRAGQLVAQRQIALKS